MHKHNPTNRTEFLVKFTPVPSPAIPSVGGALAERLAGRLLVFALRHAALARPASQAGRLQLAKDLAELTQPLGGQLYPLEQLGGPYRLLRAFRALLFAEVASLSPASPPLRDLPASLALHHLFSRLPAHIEAPHARAGQSPAAYSAWLDGASAEEAAERVADALRPVDAAALRAADPAAADALALMQAILAAGRY